VLHLNLLYLGSDLFPSKYGHISGKNLIYKYKDTSTEY